MPSQGSQQLPANLDKTLRELQDAISTLAPDSAASQGLNASLLSLNRTLGNLESFTRTLSEQPSAVVVPASPRPDPIPEVSTP